MLKSSLHFNLVSFAKKENPNFSLVGVNKNCSVRIVLLIVALKNRATRDVFFVGRSI